ncbi:MAG: carbohydrate kinase family protein [Sphaerochaetaceae bacterium]|nr:carbohydrate kinase family protein [Sphaerochaetaceae bacterium]
MNLKNRSPILISGVGCCVVDYVYQNIHFDNRLLEKYGSSNEVKGLTYGEASLIEDLEEISGEPIKKIIEDLTDNKPYTSLLGGVAVAALIGASQLLHSHNAKVQYYINVADDENGKLIQDSLKKTPLSLDKIRVKRGRTAITYALCDTDEDYEGTRTFISEPHIEENLTLRVSDLDRDFFSSDIVLFSCVQWEPEISDNFTDILKSCKTHNMITVVGTASDPQMRGKDKWVLGDSDEVYRYIDVLIMNYHEALYYSGTTSLNEAISYFKKSQVNSFIITHGIEPTFVYGSAPHFYPIEQMIPIVDEIDTDKKMGKLPTGDSVGCGDNFVGGVIASIAVQMEQGKKRFDLFESVISGNLNGGITSTVKGGTFYESYAGEKKKLCEFYETKYRKRLREIFSGNHRGGYS